MAIVAGTFVTTDAIGLREDLQDAIYDISPLDTPLLSMAKKLKAKARFHEWNTDILLAAGNNRQIEGDDYSYSTPTPTVRVGNYCQISRKTVVVSNTMQAVDKAGRGEELAYQVMKQGRELKRDMEFALVRVQASSAGNNGLSRSSAGLESWLSSNWTTATGSSGSPATPGFSSGTVAAPTDATVAATFIEPDLKAAIQECWSVGGQPSVIMCGPFNRQKLSAFAGNATKTLNWNGADPGAIVASAGIYVSDFGKFKVISNRFQRDRTVFMLDPDYLGVAYLRPISMTKPAITGDAEKSALVAEYCLVVQNEAAHSKLVDLTTSGAI